MLIPLWIFDGGGGAFEATGGPCEMEMFFLFDLSLSFFLNLKTHIPLWHCLDFSECVEYLCKKAESQLLQAAAPNTALHIYLSVFVRTVETLFRERDVQAKKPKIKNKTKQQTRFILERERINDALPPSPLLFLFRWSEGVGLKGPGESGSVFHC